MTAPRRIRVIADDLTGAAAVGGEIAARGIEVELLRGRSQFGSAPCVVLDTASRYAAEKVRAVSTTELVPLALAEPHSLVLLKIDSRLRGRTATDIAEYLDACGDRRVVLAPACPAVNIQTIDGRQRDGQMLDVDLVGLVSAATGDDALLLPASASPAKIADLFAHSAARVIVADATTSEHLAAVVAAATQAGISCFVGTYGIGDAMARVIEPDPAPPPGAEAEAARAVVLVGSISQPAQRQVERLAAAGAELITVDVESVLRGGSRSEQQRVSTLAAASRADVVVVHTGPPASASETARESSAALSESDVAALLAPVFGEVVANMPDADVVLVGGETAGSLVAFFGWDRFDVQGELLPGVTLIRVTGDATRRIVTKPGAFGDADALVTTIHRLRSSLHETESTTSRRTS